MIALPFPFLSVEAAATGCAGARRTTRSIAGLHDAGWRTCGVFRAMVDSGVKERDEDGSSIEVIL